MTSTEVSVYSLARMCQAMYETKYARVKCSNRAHSVVAVTVGGTKQEHFRCNRHSGWVGIFAYAGYTSSFVSDKTMGLGYKP